MTTKLVSLFVPEATKAIDLIQTILKLAYVCCLARRWKNLYSSHSNSRPIFFVRSSRIRVDLLSYESKLTDKRQQNDWRAKKNLDGLSCFFYINNENKNGKKGFLLSGLLSPWLKIKEFF